MARRPVVLAVVMGLGLGGGGTACSEQEPAGPATLPSAGMVQPAGNGLPIDEQPACVALVQAEDSARIRLGCPARAGSDCPGYLRPAGGAVCLVYDQGTVTACVLAMAGYARCDEFARHRCVVTALECSAGAGGAGGSAGNAGFAGSASQRGGSAGSVTRTGGAAGRAGAGG